MKSLPASFRAFTRIELLAVSTVLAGLIVVVLGLALRKRPPAANPLAAQRSQCLDNLRQLATAELMYVADHQGRFSPSYLDYAAMNFTSVWMGALADYHGRPDGVWLCSATTNAPANYYRGSAEAPWTYTDPASGVTTAGSYAINGYLGLGRNYKPAKEANFKPKNVFHQQATVRKTELTPMFSDAVFWNCGLEETDAPSRNLYDPQDNVVATGSFRRILTQFIARHGDFPAARAPRTVDSANLPGAINVAFADGHAENIPLDNLWTLYWHKNWDPDKVPAPHPAPK